MLWETFVPDWLPFDVDVVCQLDTLNSILCKLTSESNKISDFPGVEGPRTVIRKFK